MAIQQKVTAEEFEAFIALPENSDRLFELAYGEIVEKMPTEEHGYLAAIFIAKIFNYPEVNPIGRVVVEARHRMPDDDQNSYLPDVAFTSSERTGKLITEGAVPQMPDLVIEIKSPNDVELKMRKKALYYLENGTQMVWLVFPRKQEIEVHEAEGIKTLTIDDTLDGGSVLPGFTLALKSIFTT
jgi:Uma2 family endonuclease